MLHQLTLSGSLNFFRQRKARWRLGDSNSSSVVAKMSRRTRTTIIEEYMIYKNLEVDFRVSVLYSWLVLDIIVGRNSYYCSGCY
jgi:hypothetical protein